jgi:hypothetical protein
MRLAIAGVLHMLRRMMRSLRTFLILLTMLTFTVSSVGWSLASASAASGSGGHHAVIDGDRESDHHGDNANLAHESDCERVDVGACGTNHDDGKLANSCCAMACHTAIPNCSYFTSIAEIVRLIDPPAFQVGIKEASGPRFERPPRSAVV